MLNTKNFKDCEVSYLFSMEMSTCLPQNMMPPYVYHSWYFLNKEYLFELHGLYDMCVLEKHESFISKHLIMRGVITHISYKDCEVFSSFKCELLNMTNFKFDSID